MHFLPSLISFTIDVSRTLVSTILDLLMKEFGNCIDSLIPLFSHHLTSHHTTSHHITPHHITSPHITSHYTQGAVMRALFDIERVIAYWQYSPNAHMLVRHCVVHVVFLPHQPTIIAQTMDQVCCVVNYCVDSN